MSVKKITSSDELVTSADIQVKYEHLYKFLMDFLWEFRVVQTLANLEIAIFKRFPDKDEMLKYLLELKKDIANTYNELAEDDETEFKDAVEELEDAINAYDAEKAGCELYAVEEVLPNPEEILGADDMDASEDRRKFKFGNIKKTTKEERELQEEAARTLQNPFENGEGGEE